MTVGITEPGTSLSPYRQPTAVTPAGIDFTTEQIDTIKRTIAKGASDTELDLFLAICRRTGLDPFLKQIHLIPRRSQTNGQWVTAYQPMVGIDGMRLTAERTGKYGGQDPTLFLDAETGAWEEVWHGQGHPFAAKATVYRKDWAKASVAITLWDEYVQTNASGAPNATWSKMPTVMLGKCAESLAFRRAFPAEMSQLAVHMGGDFDSGVLEIEASERAQTDPYYAGPDSQWQKDRDAEDFIEAAANDDSIDPDDLPFEPEGDVETEPIPPITEGQQKAIEANGKMLAWTDRQLADNVGEHLQTEYSVEELTQAQAAEVLRWQKTLLEAKGKKAVEA